MSLSVIDKFVLALGFDSAELKKQRREAAAEVEKFKVDAKRLGDDIEADEKRHSDALRKLTLEAVTFYAILKSASAIRSFIDQLTASDAALGRMSARLGQAPEALGGFGLAAERSGGNAQAAMQSFQAYSDAIQDWRSTGSAGIIDTLARLAHAGAGAINPLASMDDQLAAINANLYKQAQTDPAKASWLGRQLGFDPDTVSMMTQAPEKYRELLEAAKKYAPSADDVRKSQDYRTALTEISQAARSVWRTAVTTVSPAITDLLKRFQAWIDANKEWLATNIKQAIEDIARDLGRIDWPAIGRGMLALVSGSASLLSNLTGAKGVAIGLFGMWAGGKLLALVGAFSALRFALGLVGVAAIAAAIGGGGSQVLHASPGIDVSAYRGRSGGAGRSRGGPGGDSSRGGVYTRGRRAAAEQDDASLQSSHGGKVEEVQGREAATRKGKISGPLREAFDFASSKTGLTVRVTSGGQRMPGAWGAVGSHRHDGGNAADYNLVDEKGRIVSPNDPRALKFFEHMGMAGATGGNAGYMSDPNKIHSDLYNTYGHNGSGAAMREAVRRGAARRHEYRRARAASANPFGDLSGASRVFRGDPSVTSLAPAPGTGVVMNSETPGRPIINKRSSSFDNITVYSQATDAPGIARDIRQHIQKNTEGAE